MKTESNVRLVYDTSKPYIYDFNEPDAQFTMFDRKLEGCVNFRFSDEVDMNSGIVTMNGKKVPHVIVKLYFGGKPEWWIGIKPGGILHDYELEAMVKLEGFCDKEGAMIPTTAFLMKTEAKRQPDPAYAEHEKVALQVAEDGIVLLKNENDTLPLKGEKALNIFGKGIFEFKLCAVGAGKILPRHATGFLEAARREKELIINEELISFYSCGENRVPDETLLMNAKKFSDVAVMVITRFSGENADNSTDRGEYYLSEEEEILLSVLRAQFAKLIVILNVGYPISTSFAEKYQVDALVYSGFGGMFAGTAIMNVLTGRVNPSGKLPDTWSENYDSIPASKNFYDCAGGKLRIGAEEPLWLNTVYEEDIYVGYRYFETFEQSDKKGYPFGFGLSYTTFDIQCREFVTDEKGLRVQVEITNTGAYAGREVVQLYLSKPQGILEQPAKELVEFEKTSLLQPGESEIIYMEVPVNHMTSFEEKTASYIMVPGEYKVHIGNYVRHTEEIGAFVKSEKTVIKQVKNRMKPNLPIQCMSQKEPDTYPKGINSGVQDGVTCLKPLRKNVETFVHKLLPKTDRKITYQDVLEEPSLLEEFVGNMSVKELARIAVCAKDGWGMDGRGEAGRIYRPEGLGLPEFIVADGNSGVNLYTRNIGFPSGATLCATFDKELMQKVGETIAEEALENNIHLIMGPGMNLHRNPLNGRQPEYFSEDPYLAGMTAGRFCKGLETKGVGGCYKHFLGNNAESGRKRNQSVMTERALRELYFRAFEYAIEEQKAVSIMTAYNAVNGLFTSCDPELIQGLLYEECDFEGFVMTDWASYASADVVEMVAAGNSWITPGSEDDTYTSQVEAGVEDGRIPLAQLQDNVLRILRVLVKLNRR